MPCATSRLISLSSTSRISRDWPRCSGWAAAGSWAAERCRGRLKLKRQPSPGRLARRRSPPMAATSLRLMASPSPVPPWCPMSRLRWRNASNTASCSCSGMPGPVSLTTNRMQGSAQGPPHGRGLTSRQIRPLAVNLTALPKRLPSTWRSLPRSPSTTGGRAGAYSSTRATPLASALGLNRALSSSTS
ncbi:hypothetical protein D3C75_730570 [compost metagenome]